MITRGRASQARDLPMAPPDPPWSLERLKADGDQAMPEMKLPGPDHPITIAFNPKRVEVVYNGHTIADTRRALELKEASYHPAQYIPREDVDMAFLTRTDHHTYCPYKG